MGSFGIVVLAVLAVGVLVGILLTRQPSPWDEIGDGGFDPPSTTSTSAPPSRADDEADLRALLDRKRAARRARAGAAADEPARPLAQGPPWAHMESEVVEEARALVARRRERLARQGKPDVDETAELERLLGPPHL